MKLICLLSFLVLSLNLHAGSYFKITTEGGKDPGESEIFIDSSKIKISSAKKDGFIYDEKTEMMTFFSGKEKEYWQMNKTQMKEMTNKLSGMMAKMQAQFAKMPPQQRKMMEDMLKDKMPKMDKKKPKKNHKIKKIKSGVKVGKWSTTKFEYYTDGKKQSDFYTTHWKNLGLKEDPSRVAIKLSEAFQEMLDSMTGAFKNFASQGQSFEGMKGLLEQGIPVKVVGFKKGKISQTALVKEVKNASFSAATFTVPKGYKKKDIAKGLNKL